jgi:hypothetical protein
VTDGREHHVGRRCSGADVVRMEDLGLGGGSICLKQVGGSTRFGASSILKNLLPRVTVDGEIFELKNSLIRRGCSGI